MHIVGLTIFGILTIGGVEVTDFLPKYQDYHELKELLSEKKKESLYLMLHLRIHLGVNQRQPEVAFSR